MRTRAGGAYCGGGNELSVMPNGDIYPCHSQPCLLGSLDDLETGKIFKTDAYRLIVHRTAGNIPTCRDCDFEGLCAGGCAADALANNSDLYSRTQHCQFFQTMFRRRLEELMIAKSEEKKE